MSQKLLRQSKRLWILLTRHHKSLPRLISKLLKSPKLPFPTTNKLTKLKLRLILKRLRKPKCLKGNVNGCKRKIKFRNLNKFKNSIHLKTKMSLKSLKSLLKSFQRKKSSLSVKEPRRNKWRNKNSRNSGSSSVKSKCIRTHVAIKTSTTSMFPSTMNLATIRKAITSMGLTTMASTETAMTTMAILANKWRNTTMSSSVSKNVSRKNMKKLKQLLKPVTSRINKTIPNQSTQLLTKRMRRSLKRKKQRHCVRKS